MADRGRGLRVIRTHDDFYNEMLPGGSPVVPRHPIPIEIQNAAHDAHGFGKPITIICDGRTRTVTPEQAKKFAEWLDFEHNRLMFEALRKARGRGRPPIDWYGLLLRLIPAVKRGEQLDAVLEPLRKRYGIQSLAEAHRWIKAQRQASAARLQELQQRRTSGNVPEYERLFHEEFLRVFPPRSPGRPRRKSGR